MSSGDEAPVESAPPTRRLEGEEEGRYLETLAGALRAARLSAQYPDPRRLASHLGVLAPERHRGLYPGLEVDLRSGLPTYKEWTRARTDVLIADEQLAMLGSREACEARARTSPIHAKQLSKLDYYAAVRGAALAPLGEMEVSLRRVAPEEKRAWFHVLFDKLDASGPFVRHSIDLSQLSHAFRERAVVLDEETARHTEAFRALIYKLTTLEAELTLVKLATMGGLAVERVVKGVVGPVFFPWSRAPADVHRLLGADGFVATFGLDMAAPDVTEERDNDPFKDLAAERLAPEMRRACEQARRQLGYKVWKDRKLVTRRDLVPALQRLCEARGTRNIVYGI